MNDIFTKNSVENLLIEKYHFFEKNKIFYKYSDFDTGLNKILIDKSLKFSNPDCFNDPFDCHEDVLKLEISDNTIFEYTPQNLTRNKRRKALKLFRNEKSLKNIKKNLKSNFLISCFTIIFNDVLMWTNYGKNHTGICIGFDFPKRLDKKFILCPVHYIKDVIPHDGTADTIHTALIWMSTKSDNWQYEKEVRAISKIEDTNKDGLIYYDRKYVKEVIFGCRVPLKEISKTKTALLNAGYDISSITFKIMQITDDNFKLKERII